MPSESENIRYLYLVLTHEDNPTIDWDAVGAALDLNKAAVTKRWSRLKVAVDKGEAPSGSAYQFLWLCVKHSTRIKPLNWAEIARQCNTSAGAAAKRYSRMKKKFEDNDTTPATLPSSPIKAATAKSRAAPKSAIKKELNTAEDVKASPNAKRKRSVVAHDDAKYKPSTDSEEEDELHEDKPKRAKPNRRKNEATVKQEDEEEDGGDAFFDAQEVVGSTTRDAGENPEELTDSLALSDVCV